MKHKRILTLLLLAVTVMTASAQRFTDRLDRGLIAMRSAGANFVSWRIQADEYYDVKYNLYRDGALVAQNLTVSNFKDTSGSTSSKYSVEAVRNGVKIDMSPAVEVWSQDYLFISPNHSSSLKSTYIPNDACCADVDGDGQVEILMKYTNQQEANSGFPKEGNNGEYTLFECLKLDGTVLWWVNCGPNMGDFQNNEQNIVGYDWDMDGKAEVIMRLCEGAVIHLADGTEYLVKNNAGTGWTNYRVPKSGGTEWFTHYGDERLLYVNGATGKPYVDMEYPLKRLEDSEWDGQYLHGGTLGTFEDRLKSAWGDGYGHRSNKFFFGAPYLDGRKPSIFLGRGIYTRHKFIALDVDPATHQLKTRWTWNNNTSGPWKGQGYHNYAIVDVDWDGRDEIVWGSMVIDDNGLGLSTTGLGHGDAQHHGDLDPYTWGQEGFFCNEDDPANNYRDLTTAKIYHRYAASGDDGRAIAGNFCNTIPGSMGFSAHENPISCVTGNVTSSLTKTGVGMNFRCYWDGDLCEETFNGGDNTPGNIYKYGQSAALKTFIGLTNNSTKATPCFMGDIFGDWREEFILRTSDNNIVIYSTTIPTQWRNYSLWYDHQYRNGMVWEPCGYNQPPHASYFLGEMEGITAAPPSLTMQGRKEVANGTAISAALNGESIITCETNNMTVSVADGATPYIYIDNAPSWTQGYAPSNTSIANNPDNIKYASYTHTITGGAFAGDMRLVKQGEGTLVLPNVVQKYTGDTEVWGGKLSFDGTMEKSALWLNRHTTLLSSGGKFLGGITAEYNSKITPAGENKLGEISVATLTLNMGAHLVLDIYSEGTQCDVVNMSKLVINKKNWTNGPEYLTPVFKFVSHPLSGKISVEGGKYLIGKVDAIEGDINDIVITGLNGAKGSLLYEDGSLYLNIAGQRDATTVSWKGDKSTAWDIATTANFANDGSEDIFVAGDNVVFGDDASRTSVVAGEGILPASVTFNNYSKTYTLSGASLMGGVLNKEGTALTTISSKNNFSAVNINGGELKASSLANAIGTDLGSLGDVNTPIVISNQGALTTSAALTAGQPITLGENGGGFNVTGSTLTIENPINANGKESFKNGAGTLVLPLGNKFGVFRLNKGTIQCEPDLGTGRVFGDTLVLGDGTTLKHNNDTYSYNTDNTRIKVNAGATAKWYLDGRCTYTNYLFGEGKITLYPQGNISRTLIGFNATNFTGTVDFEVNGSYNYINAWESLKLDNATLNVGSGMTFSTDYSNGSKSGSVQLRLAKLTGTGTVSGNGTVILGGQNGDFSLSANVTCPVIKEGTGIMTLTAGAIQNTISLNGGSIKSNNTATLANGTNSITINNGGRWFGNTLANGFVVNSGGLLDMQSSLGYNGTFIVNNTLKINDGAEMKMYIRSSTLASKLTVKTLWFAKGGKLTLDLLSSYTPKIGDTFTLWEATTFTGAAENAVVTLPELPKSMKWDTSKLLAKTGVISIVLAGDADDDGVVTMNDANMIINYHLSGGTKAVNSILKADANGDGIIDLKDAKVVSEIYLGM